MSQRPDPRRQPPSLLTVRDRSVLADLARVRLLTGRQLERLHFNELATVNARGSARRRSLGRLAEQGWVTTLPRRVGGERAGSAGLIYSLDARAHRERALWDDRLRDHLSRDSRVRRPWAIGWLFVAHTLDVAELYVQLREAERSHQVVLQTFDTEPASWFTQPDRRVLKPDAYVVLDADGWERHWWLEVDRATESLPTLRRKLARYTDLHQDGPTGPDGVMPRLLLTVPDERRARPARALVHQLGPAAPDLIVISPFRDALSVLPGDQPRPPP